MDENLPYDGTGYKAVFGGCEQENGLHVGIYFLGGLGQILLLLLMKSVGFFEQKGLMAVHYA
jgi:hypothetical protein